MGRLMLNDRCYTGKEATLMLNNINYSYSDPSKNYYLLDPATLDIIGSGSGSGIQGYAMTPYTIKYQSNGSVTVTTRNNEKVMFINQTSNKCYGIVRKIDKSCKTIKINAEVTGYQGNYQLAHVYIAGSPIPASYSGATDAKKTYWFATYNRTVQEINAQTGITFEIPVTAKNAMPKQTVTLDIVSLNLTDDFYIVLHNCDTYFYIRSIEILF